MTKRCEFNNTACPTASLCVNGCGAVADELTKLGQEIEPTARDEAYIWMTNEAAAKSSAAVDILDRLEFDARESGRNELHARAVETIERVQGRHDAVARLYNEAFKENTELSKQLLESQKDVEYYKAWAEGNGKRLTEAQQRLAGFDAIDGNRAELFEIVRTIRGAVARFQAEGVSEMSISYLEELLKGGTIDSVTHG